MQPSILISGINLTAAAEFGLSSSIYWQKGSEEFTDQIRNCQKLRKKHPAVEFLCPCNQRLIPRIQRKHHNEYGQMVAWPGGTHRSDTDCHCRSGKSAAPLLNLRDIQTAEGAFRSSKEDNFENIGLRLQSAGNHFARVLDAENRLPTSNFVPRARKTTKTLRGILDLFSEHARNCRYDPDKQSSTEISSYAKRMSAQVWSNKALAALFEKKTVFASLTSDFGRALTDACESPETKLKNLNEKAIVISVGKTLDGTQESGCLTFHTDPQGTIFRLSDFVVQHLSTQKSKRLMEFVRATPDAYTALIATVHLRDGAFVMEQATWCLIDRFGVIYDSEWEFLAGKQLIDAKCRFAKPASTLYRVARGRRRPDFIVFDATGKRFIVEVDPPASRLTALRKAQRDADYDSEGICYMRWNPRKHADLIDLLRSSGFSLSQNAA